MTAPGADTGAGRRALIYGTSVLPAADALDDMAYGAANGLQGDGTMQVSIWHDELATAMDAATDAARALGELEAMMDIGGVTLSRRDGQGGAWYSIEDGPALKPHSTTAAAIHALHAALVAAGAMPPLPGDGDSGAAGGGG